jgi:hypothetical protein
LLEGISKEKEKRKKEKRKKKKREVEETASNCDKYLKHFLSINI